MKLKMGITQQFCMFFLLGAVIPVVILGWLYWSSLNAKLSERATNTLDIGLLFGQDVFRTDLQALRLTSWQSSVFSIGRLYREQYWPGGKADALMSAANDYLRKRNLDFILIVDPRKEIEKALRIGRKFSLSQPGIQAVLKRSAIHSTQTIAGIERITMAGEPQLMYVAAAPLLSKNGERLGTMIFGQSMDRAFSFKEHVNLIPGLEVSIFIRQAGGDIRLLSSTNPSYWQSLWKTSPQAPLLSSLQRLGQVFLSSETGQGTAFLNESAAISNLSGQTIGYLVVSTSDRDIKALQKKNAIFLMSYLAFVLCIALLAAQWFKLSFIDPMRAMARGASAAARGDYQHRVANSAGVLVETELSETARYFNHMLDQLEEDEQMRKTFVSALTHDLRTPILAQQRVLETLLELAETSPKTSTMLDGMHRNNLGLLAIVNRLLEAYQYEAGSVRIHPEPVDVIALVKTCVEELMPLALERAIALHPEVPEALPSLQADPEQLKRLLINLIGNALGNIQRGRDVWIRAWQDTSSGDFILQVADNGPGIDPALLPRLFRRYSTGEKTRQKIGSGLGLFICRMIAELHGGTIKAESEPGKGVTFTVALPFVDKEPSPCARP